MKKFLNKIHHVDCLDFMRKIPDKAIDLCLTDPPYGIGAARSSFIGVSQRKGMKVPPTDYGNKEWDSAPPSQEIMNEIFRVSKNQIIFGGNYLALPATPCWIVWDKLNGDSSFGDCELAWTSFETAIRKFEFRWQGMLQGDMKNKEERIHPTQKPRQLFMMILERYAQKGQIILDCFSGSGTTALACHDLGLDFICVEKDFDYWDSSVKRLEQHQRQLRLV